MNEPIVTVVGNLVADPELKMSQAGKPWVSFRVASTPRVKDRQSDQWVDGEPLWLGCRAFGEFAENIEGSLTKGTRVIMQGRLSANTFTDKNGQERSGLNFEVEAIGPELRFATAQVTRNGGGGQAQQGRGEAQQPAGAPNNSPWGGSPTESNFGNDRPF